MEVVEHVADVPLFVATCAGMVKPGGLLVAATLNRTLKSFALAIVGAEYVLRWLPRGTHQWDKFVRPQELESAIENAGLRVTGERGVIYNPFADRWQLSSDMDVNDMLVAMRDGARRISGAALAAHGVEGVRRRATESASRDGGGSCYRRLAGEIATGFSGVVIRAFSYRACPIRARPSPAAWHRR